MPMKSLTIVLSVNVCVDLSSPQQVENFKVLLSLLRAEGLDTEELLIEVEKAAKVLSAARDAVKRSAEPPELVECIVCHKKFPDPQMLKEHAEEHRSKEKKYQCPLCSHGVETRPGMIHHYKTQHPDAPLPSTKELRDYMKAGQPEESEDGKGDPASTPAQDREPPEQYKLPEREDECPFCHSTRTKGRGVDAHVRKWHPELQTIYNELRHPKQQAPPESTVESKVTPTVAPVDSSEKIAPTVADPKDLEECVCGVKVLKTRMGIHQLTLEHKDRMAAMR